MPMWLTWAGFDRGPAAPKKSRSPGWIFASGIRLAAGTSPAIAYVVLPRRTPGNVTAPAYAWSLYTRQTNPEQSNPPGTVVPVPKGSCGDSLVPPHTYGYPTNETAVWSTERWSPASGAGLKVAPSDATASRSAVRRPRIRQAEYAASALVATLSGPSSR